ncbi:hypothetical protein [Nitratifractor sp.]
MQRMNVREYARRHKLSLFQVIKKINAGELASETVEENGQKVQYILLEEQDAAAREPGPRPDAQAEQTREAKIRDELLAREIALFRREIELLRAELRRCCAGKAIDG